MVNKYNKLKGIGSYAYVAFCYSIWAPNVLYTTCSIHPFIQARFLYFFFSFSCLAFTNIHSLKNPWTSNLGLDILPKDTETRRLRKPETEAPTLWLIAQLLYLQSPYMLHIAWVVLSQAKCCNLCTELMIIRFFFCKLTGPALSQNFWLMQNYLSICFQRQLGGEKNVNTNSLLKWVIHK